MTSEVVAAVAAHGLAGTHTTFPEEPLDDAAWLGLLGVVREQRLEGLLAAAASNGTMPVTSEQLDRAHELHVERMSSVLLLESALLDLHGTLTDAGLEVRVLKGSAVAHLDYVDPALRCFGDVDLLVRGDQFDAAVEVLGRVGLQRRYPQPRPGFDARFSKGTSFVTQGGIELDLHRTFVMGPFGLSIALEDLWSTSSSFSLGGADLLALDPECRFLHACFHSSLGDKVARLVPMRDVAQMLLSDELDVERVRALMLRWQARPVVARAVAQAWERLEIADVVALSAWARRFAFDARARQDLAAYLDDDADYAAKSVAALRAVPGVRDKVAFARALAFPDQAYLQGRRRGLGRLTTAIQHLRRR